MARLMQDLANKPKLGFQASLVPAILVGFGLTRTLVAFNGYSTFRTFFHALFSHRVLGVTTGYTL